MKEENITLSKQLDRWKTNFDNEQITRKELESKINSQIEELVEINKGLRDKSCQEEKGLQEIKVNLDRIKENENARQRILRESYDIHKILKEKGDLIVHLRQQINAAKELNMELEERKNQSDNNLNRFEEKCTDELFGTDQQIKEIKDDCQFIMNELREFGEEMGL